ncbi:DUF72 domain-containing protein [Chitinophaga sedimenti]|uniref:DUF72 domain-containing protein n=1 Tax=Chitinophaga sedimenti TaxID=2033606 RepID=UPI0020056037|nr:DUF72 domain-containing protein [Chitinophaga sedimenti]MCK7558688.1 DUF72 domain-containing protein [Chitinophaga sedimenti]
MQKAHIGTSGWSYKHWKEIYYPATVKSADWLSFFAKDFDCIEINNSFYRLPKPETVQQWVTTVPDGFIFCPKMNRFLSHMKKLHDPEQPLQRFFDVFDPVRKHLGPILIQLPANATFNPEVTAHFYALLHNTYRQYQFSMEVRHESWYTEESLSLMRKYDIGLVIADSGGLFPSDEVLTAKHVYLRFHGPGKLYASAYHPNTLRAYAKKCRRWLNGGHQVWAFFNNDINGYALKDAQMLRRYLSDV